MTRTVMVALIRPEEDPDRASELALPVAESLAERLDADVQLVTVLDLPSEMTADGGQRLLHAADAFPDDTRLTTLRDQTLAMVADAEAYLQRIAGRFAAGRARTVVRFGDAGQGLLDVAESLDAPIIVMTSHARRGIKRAVVGSVAFTVVSKATHPVVIVPVATVHEPSATEYSLHRILVPLDGSPLAESVLDSDLISMLSDHLELHLVQVIEPLTVHSGLVANDYYAMARDEATQYLQRITDQLRRQGRKVNWCIRSGAAGDEIAQVATQIDADAILMATHGRSGLRRIVMGSVAERVLHASSRPLFLIRSDIDRLTESSPVSTTAVQNSA